LFDDMMNEPSRIQPGFPELVADFLVERAQHESTPPPPHECALTAAERRLCDALERLLSRLLARDPTWDGQLALDGFVPRIVTTTADEVDLLGVVCLLPIRRGAYLQPFHAKIKRTADSNALTYRLAFADPEGPHPDGFSVLDLDLHADKETFGWVHTFSGALTGVQE
jgi:hypothetical protein